MHQYIQSYKLGISDVIIMRKLIFIIMYLRAAISFSLDSDLLFGNIYDTFSGEDECSKAVFLETLYDYIQDGK